MPVSTVALDLSTPPFTPPEPKRVITITFGKDILPFTDPSIGRSANIDAFVAAVRRELIRDFPHYLVEIAFGPEEKSTIACNDGALAGSEESRNFAAEAQRSILRVLQDPWRYEWSGVPLADPKQAIDYLLTRAQRDPDLGHLLGPCTQAFNQLCEAEAKLLGKPLSEVLDARGRAIGGRERTYFTEVEHQRRQEKREQASHLDAEDSSRS